MNISQIIKYLERKPADKIVPMGFSSPGAYRDSNQRLCVEPTPDISVGDMLFAVRYALGTTYPGLHGDSYMMMPGTDVYLAPYGKTGKSITRVLLDEMFRAHDKNVRGHPRTVRQLDAALKAMNVSYYVRHSMFALPMPRAITVASSKRIDVSHLNACVLNMVRAIMRGDVADGESVGAFVKHQLARYGYKHVAVCSRGDVFSQTRGELIALGRLLKAQRKQDMPFDRRLPALPSRRRNDAQRQQAIVRAKALAKLRAMFASTNPQCILRVSASDETVAECDFYSCSCRLRYGIESCAAYCIQEHPPMTLRCADDESAHDRDTTQAVVIGCRTRDSYVTICDDCKLTYGSDSCMKYRDDTAAKPWYADAEETTTSPHPQPTPHDDPTQDIVIGCGQSLKCHTSENTAHFMFCRYCSYTYSNDPDSKCSRYRAAYSLIGQRHIIRAYESDE